MKKITDKELKQILSDFSLFVNLRVKYSKLPPEIIEDYIKSLKVKKVSS